MRKAAPCCSFPMNHEASWKNIKGYTQKDKAKHAPKNTKKSLPMNFELFRRKIWLSGKIVWFSGIKTRFFSASCTEKKVFPSMLNNALWEPLNFFFQTLDISTFVHKTVLMTFGDLIYRRKNCLLIFDSQFCYRPRKHKIQLLFLLLLTSILKKVTCDQNSVCVSGMHYKSEIKS